jgi:hypothetical protein
MWFKGVPWRNWYVFAVFSMDAMFVILLHILKKLERQP